MGKRKETQAALEAKEQARAAAQPAAGTIDKDVDRYMKAAIKAIKDRKKFDDEDIIAMDILRYHFQNWRMAAEEIQRQGMLIVGGNGQLAKNPAYDVATTSLKMALAIMQDYGLTAMSRKKLTKGEPDPNEPISPLEQFFAENGGYSPLTGKTYP